MTDLERIERTKALLARPTTVVTRPVWIGCDGYLRLSRGDMRQMLEDLGFRTCS